MGLVLFKDGEAEHHLIYFATIPFVIRRGRVVMVRLWRSVEYVEV